jgi:hypothetical protein
MRARAFSESPEIHERVSEEQARKSTEFWLPDDGLEQLAPYVEERPTD